jgi:hypothetical protein
VVYRQRNTVEHFFNKLEAAKTSRLVAKKKETLRGAATPLRRRDLMTRCADGKLTSNFSSHFFFKMMMKKFNQCQPVNRD